MIRREDDQRFVRVLRGRQNNKIFSIWKNHTYYRLSQDSPVDLGTPQDIFDRQISTNNVVILKLQ